MLKKIFWVVLLTTILLWTGVGIYYFQPETTVSPTEAVVQEPSPTSQKIVAENPIPTASNNLKNKDFIIGKFLEWENIENSQDRYILLTNSENNQPLPKIRVGFEFSNLFGYDGNEDITVFTVKRDSEKYDMLYALKYFTNAEIDKLIKKNDWVEIYFQKKINEEVNLKDENGNYLAHGLSISRPNGKTEIEQELGRVIQKPQNP